MNKKAELGGASLSGLGVLVNFLTFFFGSNIVGRFGFLCAAFFCAGLAVAWFVSYFAGVVFDRRELRATLRGLSDSARALLFELGESRAVFELVDGAVYIDGNVVPRSRPGALELLGKGFFLPLQIVDREDVKGGVYCLSDKGAAAFREGNAAGLFGGLED